MSFFRPHRSKPRQFNYIPRHYDPVKEERDRRRRELHGTSSESDDEVYTPGKYIRTQRDARDVAREESANSSSPKIRNMTIMMVIIALFALIIVPRFITFFNMVREEKEAQKAEIERAEEQKLKRLEFVEYIESQEGIDDAQIFMQGQDEIDAWQRSVNVIYEGEEMRNMKFEIFSILSEEMKDSSSEEMTAEFLAIEDPEKWLEEHRAKNAK